MENQRDIMNGNKTNTVGNGEDKTISYPGLEGTDLEADLRNYFISVGDEGKAGFLDDLEAARSNRGLLMQFVERYVSLFTSFSSGLNLKGDRVEFLYDRLSELFYSDHSVYHFTSNQSHLPTMRPKLITKLQLSLKKTLHDHDMYGKQRKRKLKEYEDVIRLRREMFTLRKWDDLHRITPLAPAYSYFPRLDGFDVDGNFVEGKGSDRVPNIESNDIYRVKTDLYNKLKRMSSGVLPGFLKDRSIDVQKAMIGVHFGNYMSFLSSFLDDKGVCTSILNDKDHLMNQVFFRNKSGSILHEDGKAIFKPSNDASWVRTYRDFTPGSSACSPLQSHSSGMLKFVSQLKTMMEIYQIASSGDIEAFVTAYQPPLLRKKLESKIGTFIFENECNLHYLPSCGCTGEKNELNTNLRLDGTDRHFCFHDGLPKHLLSQYHQLFLFHRTVTNLSSLTEQQNKINLNIQSTDNHSNLIDYQMCPCTAASGHLKVNVHSLGFGDTSLFLLIALSAQMLRGAHFSPRLLNLGSVGEDDSRFEKRVFPANVKVDCEGTIHDKKVEYDAAADKMVDSLQISINGDECYVTGDHDIFTLYDQYKTSDEKLVLDTLTDPDDLKKLNFHYHVCWNGQIICVIRGKRYDLPRASRKYFRYNQFGSTHRATGEKLPTIRNPAVEDEVLQLLQSQPELCTLEFEELVSIVIRQKRSQIILSAETIKERSSIHVVGYDFCSYLPGLCQSKSDLPIPKSVVDFISSSSSKAKSVGVSLYSLIYTTKRELTPMEIEEQKIEKRRWTEERRLYDVMRFPSSKMITLCPGHGSPTGKQPIQKCHNSVMFQPIVTAACESLGVTFRHSVIGSDIGHEFVGDAGFIYPYCPMRDFAISTDTAGTPIPLNLGELKVEIMQCSEVTLSYQHGENDNYQLLHLLMSMASDRQGQSYSGIGPIQFFNSQYNKVGRDTPDIEYASSVILGHMDDPSIFPVYSNVSYRVRRLYLSFFSWSLARLAIFKRLKARDTGSFGRVEVLDPPIDAFRYCFIGEYFLSVNRELVRANRSRNPLSHLSVEDYVHYFSQMKVTSGTRSRLIETFEKLAKRASISVKSYCINLDRLATFLDRIDFNPTNYRFVADSCQTEGYTPFILASLGHSQPIMQDRDIIPYDQYVLWDALCNGEKPIIRGQLNRFIAMCFQVSQTCDGVDQVRAEGTHLYANLPPGEKMPLQPCLPDPIKPRRVDILDRILKSGFEHGMFNRPHVPICAIKHQLAPAADAIAFLIRNFDTYCTTFSDEFNFCYGSLNQSMDASEISEDVIERCTGKDVDSSSMTVQDLLKVTGKYSRVLVTVMSDINNLRPYLIKIYNLVSSSVQALLINRKLQNQGSEMEDILQEHKAGL